MNRDELISHAAAAATECRSLLEAAENKTGGYARNLTATIEDAELVTTITDDEASAIGWQVKNAEAGRGVTLATAELLRLRRRVAP